MSSKAGTLDAELHSLRQQIAIFTDAVAQLAGADNPDNVIAEVESNLLDMDEAHVSRASGVSLDGALNVAVERMNAAFHGEALPGVSLGIPELEDVADPSDADEPEEDDEEEFGLEDFDLSEFDDLPDYDQDESGLRVGRQT